MYEYKLLNSHRNEVLEAIKESGLDPFNFNWSKTTSMHDYDTEVPVLAYGDGEYYFQFDVSDGKQFAAYSPGVDGVDETNFPGEWVGQLRYVTTWLTCLKYEVEQPDLWAELGKYRVIEDQNALNSVLNEPFTANQAEQIQIGLLKVRSYLEQFTKDNEQKQQFVNEQLDYLVTAANRQGKRDWLHTSIGVIVTITTALSLAPEEAKNIWDVLKSTLAGILQLPHL